MWGLVGFCGCPSSSDEGIRATAAGCAALTSLSVALCSKLAGESIKAIATGCASLTSLNVK